MKLVRYGNPGREKPGLIDSEGKLRDPSSVVPDIGSEQLGAVPGAHPQGRSPSCLPCAATRASAARWRTCRSSSPSA